MQADSDFVEDGCGDVSLVLKLFCDRHHIPCEIKAGRVVVQGEAFDHVWLEVDGARFDPLAYLQGYAPSSYAEDLSVLDDLLCSEPEDVEWRVEELIGSQAG
jgi:hypothetical protein